MPVMKCKNGKYRIGEGKCMYKTKEDADKAQKGYYGTMRTAPAKIKLAEDTPIEEVPNEVQLMRTCSFYHKQYGKVDITKRLFDEMVENFGKNVRGIDVMIDYAHDSDREAAGWIKDLNVREVQLSEGDEQTGIEPITEYQLWATVDWTPKGRKTLSDKEFVYLSADFDPNYKDNENPTHEHGAVLLGAGLTNRPVIKKMKPAVQLSEFSKTITRSDGMTLEEMQEKLNSTKVKLSEMEGEKSDMEKELSDKEAKLAEVNKLMEDMGVSSLEDLMEAIKDLKKENVELSEKKEKVEREKSLNKLFSEGKISNAQKEKALKMEKVAFDGFIELAEMNEKTVKLSEDGNGNTPKEESKEDVEEKVFELAEKKMKDDSCSMQDAISFVLSENKELKEAYYKKGDE